MATQFNEVYEFFLVKVTDYSFIKLTQVDLEDELKGFMLVAITKFKRCKTDLSDRTSVQFNQTLTDDEKNILATLMVVEYLMPKIITSEVVKMQMADKDFKVYSQANHLKEVKSLYKLMKSEANVMIGEYTYENKNLDDLL